MGSCTSQTFLDFKDTHWINLVQKCAKRGVNISNVSGTYRQFGFVVSWSYLSTERKLSIQCIEKPFFILSSVITEKIEKFVKNCMR